MIKQDIKNHITKVADFNQRISDFLDASPTYPADKPVVLAFTQEATELSIKGPVLEFLRTCEVNNRVDLE